MPPLPADAPVLVGLTARELAGIAAPLLAGAGTLLFLMAVFEPRTVVPARIGLVTVTTVGAVLTASIAYQNAIDRRRALP